ncbi:MAG: hypothetical protein ACYC5X_12995 [Syntrophales bacterium]
MKKTLYRVWHLKDVTLSAAGKKTFIVALLMRRKQEKRVEKWISLGGHPELILWERYIDDETYTAR